MAGTLYHSWGTRSSRALWMSLELGVELQLKDIQLSKGDHKSADYLKINPNGVIPAFQDDKVTLYESTAICYYLLDKYDKDDKFAGARGSKERANLYKLTAFAISTVDDAVVGYALNTMFLPEQMRNAQKAEESKKAFHDKVVPVLEKELGDQKYFNGDRFTAVDVVVGYILGVANRCQLLETHAKLKAYVERLAGGTKLLKAITAPKA